MIAPSHKQGVFARKFTLENINAISEAIPASTNDDEAYCRLY